MILVMTARSKYRTDSFDPSAGLAAESGNCIQPANRAWQPAGAAFPAAAVS